MKLNSLFGKPIEIKENEFAEAVKKVLLDIKNVDIPKDIQNNPLKSIDFISLIMQGYKSMLEDNFISGRTLRGILRNTCKVSLYQYNLFTNMGMKKVYSYIKEVLEHKNKDYGNSALKNGGLVGNYVRMSDKISRIENLQKKENPNFESLQDTWLDLAGYAILGLVILSYCQEELN